MKTGIDIGGTKCAVVLGDENGITQKIKFQTTDCEHTVDQIIRAVESMGCGDTIGISCGGPLDSAKGVIMSPPNLLGWDNVPITKILSEKFGVPAYLCNDANACALAEWKYGAGRGSQNMIFLTFGTGMGAGLILNGKLYEGACGMAGEIGHMRIADFGPIGYGKIGSFEGFCSGGGIAQIGKMLATEKLQRGEVLPYCKSVAELDCIDAKLLATYAFEGEQTALEAYAVCGKILGHGISVLIDLFNPEVIVIGSVFQRAEALLRPHMESVVKTEALAASSRVCKIKPALLGDDLGDYAALSVAFQGAL